MGGWDGVAPLVWDSNGKGSLSKVRDVLKNVIPGKFWSRTISSHKPTTPGGLPWGIPPDQSTDESVNPETSASEAVFPIRGTFPKPGVDC